MNSLRNYLSKFKSVDVFILFKLMLCLSLPFQTMAFSESCWAGKKAEKSREEDDLELFKTQQRPLKRLKHLNEVSSSLDFVEMGTRLKMLANLYLKDTEEPANVFLPFYILEYEDAIGNKQTEKGFFLTSNGKICAFASGGFKNAWEKTVGHVQKIFFEDKVKIIRAMWIQKHLKDVVRDLKEKFEGKENELHSEFFYDLFFEHFFYPRVADLVNGGKIRKLTIQAFSWWEVCNNCERRLATHQRYLPQGAHLSYEIFANQKYFHDYPPGTPLKSVIVPSTHQENAEKQIWSQVTKFTPMSFQDEQKEAFWTKEKNGLNLCKWLGQAFEEDDAEDDDEKAKGRKIKTPLREDPKKYFQNVPPQETQALKTLLSYLRQKNWELSCWYRPPYPTSVQNNWNKYRRYIVVPHFGWTEIKRKRNDEGEVCQMCGHKPIKDVAYVFHPKFRVSKKFLRLSLSEQKEKFSLHVGSECVEFLSLSLPEVNNLLQKRPKRKDKEKELLEREKQNALIDKLEKEMTEKKHQKRKKRKSSPH